MRVANHNYYMIQKRIRLKPIDHDDELEGDHVDATRTLISPIDVGYVRKKEKLCKIYVKFAEIAEIEQMTTRDHVFRVNSKLKIVYQVFIN